MRFVKVFSRSKGGGPSPVLGTDGATNVPPVAAPSDADNDVSTLPINSSGYPVQNIAIAYRAPAGSTTALDAQLWLFERLTSAWFLASASVSLPPNTITRVPVPSVIGSAAGGASARETPSGGAVDAKLIVQDGGPVPNGEHTFALSGDASA